MSPEHRPSSSRPIAPELNNRQVNVLNSAGADLIGSTVERQYAAWNGEAMTFEAMAGELADYIAHLLHQTTPREHVSDCKQEALLKLWTDLQHDPDWITKHQFTNKGGLARRLAYDGRQQHGAWGPVQRLDEERVINEATLNEGRATDIDNDDTYLTIGGHSQTSNTDFWRDLSEIEPRNLDVILYSDGCHPDWRDLADMRLDLVAAINHVFESIQKDKHERTGWALMNLVYGITVEQAAYMAGITRPAMNAHVIRCRKLMREKLVPYARPNQNSKAGEAETVAQNRQPNEAREPEQHKSSKEKTVPPSTIPQLNVWLKLLTRLVQVTGETVTHPQAKQPAETTDHKLDQIFTLGVVSVLLKLACPQTKISNTESKQPQKETPQTLPMTKSSKEPLGKVGSSHFNIMMDGVLLRYPL